MCIYPKYHAFINFFVLQLLQQQSQEGQGTEGQSSNQGVTSTNQSENNQTINATNIKASSIKATPAMVRCSKIMKMQRDIHTTVLSSLEGIAEQVTFHEISYKSSK